MKKQFDPHMHTAEHILNQTMVRLFDTGRCFSAHIQRKKSKSDYRFGHPLTSEEEQQIANQVNNVIKADLPVTERFTSLSEAEEEFDLSRLPEGSSDKIRIIAVGDYDQCPCIGPHVSTTSEIGHFRITSSSFEEGVLRIRFKLNREHRF